MKIVLSKNMEVKSMKFELFATDHSGEVVFLGTYGQEKLLLEAFDQYTGMGYKKIKYYQVV